jgi:hypothetical protein
MEPKNDVNLEMGWVLTPDGSGPANMRFPRRGNPRQDALLIACELSRI